MFWIWFWAVTSVERGFSNFYVRRRPRCGTCGGKLKGLAAIRLVSLIVNAKARGGIRRTHRVCGIVRRDLHGVTGTEMRSLRIIRNVKSSGTVTLRTTVRLNGHCDLRGVTRHPSVNDDLTVCGFLLPRMESLRIRRYRLLLVGRGFGLVGRIPVDRKKLARATISIHEVVERTILGGTAVLTLTRGRPSGSPRPDETSSVLAGDIGRTYSVVHVFFVSRIVVTSKYCCSCRSEKGVNLWEWQENWPPLRGEVFM